MTLVSLDMAYRSFRGGSGRLRHPPRYAAFNQSSSPRFRLSSRRRFLGPIRTLSGTQREHTRVHPQSDQRMRAPRLYPRIFTSLATTRWHGIDGSSFDRITAPTARAAFGFPAFEATSSYVIVLPFGILRTISRTLSENVFFICQV